MPEPKMFRHDGARWDELKAMAQQGNQAAIIEALALIADRLDRFYEDVMEQLVESDEASGG